MPSSLLHKFVIMPPEYIIKHPVFEGKYESKQDLGTRIFS